MVRKIQHEHMSWRFFFFLAFFLFFSLLPSSERFVPFSLLTQLPVDSLVLPLPPPFHNNVESLLTPQSLSSRPFFFFFFLEYTYISICWGRSPLV